MKQLQSISYQDEVRSKPLNLRFLDLSKPSVLRGYHLRLGTTPFAISLTRGLSKESAAVTPSGVKITEPDDVVNAVEVTPNKSDEARIDAVYLRYEYGEHDAVGTYEVVEGVSYDHPINPNPSTHLLLGWVTVPEGGKPLTDKSFREVPKGVRIPEIIGDTIVSGDFTIDGNVTITGDLDSNVDSDVGVTIERLSQPITNVEGKQDFTLPKPYIMNTNTLFLFVNDRLLMPGEYIETTPQTFKLAEPLKKGDRLWAYWFMRIKMVRPADHDHDDRYYTKEEIDKRMVIYDTGKFSGLTGTVIEHNLNGMDYSVVGVTPTEKSTNVGYVSVTKSDDAIYVYNSGSYRGTFDIAYVLNNDDDNFPAGIGNIYKTSSEDVDAGIHAYRTVNRYRKNGTLHSRSELKNSTTNGLYTRLELTFFDYKGEKEVAKRAYKLMHDKLGRVTGTEREV